MRDLIRISTIFYSHYFDSKLCRIVEVVETVAAHAHVHIFWSLQSVEDVLGITAASTIPKTAYGIESTPNAVLGSYN